MPGNIASFEEMSLQWRAVGNTVSNLTSLRFEPQTFRSRYQRVTARPNGRSVFSQSQKKVFELFSLRLTMSWDRRILYITTTTIGTTTTINAFVSGAGSLLFSFGTVKSNPVFSSACHNCDISLREAVSPRHSNVEIGPAN